MLEPFLKKLARYGPPPKAAVDALLAALSPTRVIEPGVEMIKQFSQPVESTLLITGLAGRLVTLLDGEQQLTALHASGDFVDLHAFVLGRMDHSVVAVTRCEITTIGHGALRAVTEAHPQLARSLWFLTMIDAATHRQWLTMLGRRDALSRTAHLICEMFMRFADAGLVDAQRFSLPLKQTEIGDVLCLSSVHVNRVIQDLRARGLITWKRDQIEILDWASLAEIAEFDPTYLQLEFVPDPR